MDCKPRGTSRCAEKFASNLPTAIRTLTHLKALIQEAQPRGTEVLNADISYAAKSRMERLMQKIAEKPEDMNQVKELEEIAA